MAQSLLKSSPQKLTIIESPINQVTDGQVQARKLPVVETPERSKEPLADPQSISRRLMEKVRKLERAQESTDRKQQQKVEEKAHQDLTTKTEVPTYADTNISIKVTNHYTPQKVDRTVEPLVNQASPQIHPHSNSHSSHSKSSLEGLMQQLGQLKRSVSEIRQQCEKSPFRSPTKEGSWKKPQEGGSAHYQYENYRDLSDKKFRTYDRSGFPWMKNEITNVKQFVIDAADYKRTTLSFSPEK